MNYEFNYDSYCTGCEIELHVTVKYKIEEGPSYDTPFGPLGHGASIVDSKVIKVETMGGSDLTDMYKTASIFQDEVDRAVYNLDSVKVIDQYWKEKG